MGGASNPWPLVEPSCLGTGINPEKGGLGGPGGDNAEASVVNIVVGASSTTTSSTTISGILCEIFRSKILFQ